MQTLSKYALYLEKFIGSKIFFGLTMGWYVTQSLFVAAVTQYGLPPDERWHQGLIHLYAKDGIDPFIQNQADFFFLGDVTRNVSFLYHYLLSFIQRFFDLIGHHDGSLFTLRILSLVMGLATIYLIVKILNELKASKYITNIVIFLLTNTTMFVFLSASVNYDSMTITVASAVFLFMIQCIKKVTLNRLLALFAATLVGLMTKQTIIPIAALVVGALIYNFRGEYSKVYKKLLKNWRKPDRTTRILLVANSVLILLFSSTYIVNLVKYQDTTPKCERIHALADCRKSAIYLRNEGFAQRKPDPADLLRFDAFVSRWFNAMQDRTYGVFGSKNYSPNKKIQLAITAFLALGLLALVRYIKPKDKLTIYLLAIGSLYYLILLWFNWGLYKRYGILGYALQGRYALPILFIFYYLASHYSYILLRKRVVIRNIFFSMVLAVFFFASLPSFILKTDSTWWNDWYMSIAGK